MSLDIITLCIYLCSSVNLIGLKDKRPVSLFPRDPLIITCIAVNNVRGGLIACGYSNGEIRICHNASDVTATYFAGAVVRKKRVSPYEDNM